MAFPWSDGLMVALCKAVTESKQCISSIHEHKTEEQLINGMMCFLS